MVERKPKHLPTAGSTRASAEAPDTTGCVCFALRKSARAVTQLYDAALEPIGLRATQFSLLASLRVGGPLTVSKLAEAMGVDPRMVVQGHADGESVLVEEGTGEISLTVVAPRGRRFDVAVIPVTLAETNLGSAEMGQRVNVEADMLGKWVEKLLEARR